MHVFIINTEKTVNRNKIITIDFVFVFEKNTDLGVLRVKTDNHGNPH